MRTPVRNCFSHSIFVCSIPRHLEIKLSRLRLEKHACTDAKQVVHTHVKTDASLQNGQYFPTTDGEFFLHTNRSRFLPGTRWPRRRCKRGKSHRSAPHTQTCTRPCSRMLHRRRTCPPLLHYTLNGTPLSDNLSRTARTRPCGAHCTPRDTSLRDNRRTLRSALQIGASSRRGNGPLRTTAVLRMAHIPCKQSTSRQNNYSLKTAWLPSHFLGSTSFRHQSGAPRM
jgi:hypothetical protein